MVTSVSCGLRALVSEFKKAVPRRELVLRGQVDKKVCCVKKGVGGQGIVPNPPKHI